MPTDHSSFHIHSILLGLAEDAEQGAALRERRIKGIGPAIVALAALCLLGLGTWTLGALLLRLLAGA